MPRRYRRRRYAIARPLKTAKYSNETYGGRIELSNVQTTAVMVIVPKTEVLATRKVKNLTIRHNVFAIKYNLNPTAQPRPPNSVGNDIPIGINFCVIFLPEGTQINDLNFGLPGAQGVTNAVSVYEPNQNVIMSGQINNRDPTVVKTRLARNLNSGDQIVIVYGLNWVAADIPMINVFVDAISNYAISY